MPKEAFTSTLTVFTFYHKYIIKSILIAKLIQIHSQGVSMYRLRYG